MRYRSRATTLALTALALSCGDLHDGHAPARSTFGHQGAALTASDGLTAAQNALNFAGPAANGWVSTNTCVGCHQGNSLFAAGVAAPAGLQVDVSNNSTGGLGWLASQLIAIQSADGGWLTPGYGPHSNGARLQQTAMAAFQLTSFSGLSTDDPRLGHVKKALVWLQTQTGATGSYHPPVTGNPPYASASQFAVTFPNDGKSFAGQTRPFIPQDLGTWPLNDWVIPTAQTAIATSLLLQNDVELSPAEIASFQSFQANLTDAIEGTYARTAPGTLPVQDVAFMALALTASGRLPGNNANALAMKNELVSRQTNGGWIDSAVASLPNPLTTAEAAYALCKQGVPSSDASLNGALTWLTAQQGANGSWAISGHTADLANAFAATALACANGSAITGTLSPSSATVNAGSATTSAVTSTLTIANQLDVSTNCTFTASGGTVDSTLDVSPTSALIAANSSANATLSVTLPAGLVAGSYPVSVTARCTAPTPSGFSSTVQTLNISTSGLMPGSTPTATSLQSGANGTLVAGSTGAFVATVSQDGTPVTTGTVTVYLGTTAIGTGSYDPGTQGFVVSGKVDGVAPGTQLLTAVYSGRATDNLARSSTQSVVTVQPPFGAVGQPLATVNPPVITSPTDGTTTTNPNLSIIGTCTSGATVTLYDGATLIGNVTPMTGTTFTMPLTVAIGVHSYTANQKVSTTTSANSSPAVTVTIAPTAPVLSSPADKVQLTSTNVAISINGVAGATASLYDGGTKIGTFTVSSGSTATGNVTLAWGVHTLTVDQTLNGVTSATTSASTVTVTPPAPTITSPAANAQIVGTTATIAGTTVASATITVYIDGVASATTLTADAGGNVSGSLSLTYGSHSLAFTQTIGGQTSAQTASVTVTMLPGAPVITSPTSGTTLHTKAVTVTGTGAVGATITLKDGPTTLASLTVATNGQFTGSFTLNAGTHTFTATQTAGGQTSATSTSVSISITDVTPPVISGVPANQSIEATSPTGAAATWTQPTATDDFDATVSVTCTPASGATFPVGVTTVTCTATDSSKNTSSATFTITVTDTKPPVLTLPADVTAEASNASGIVFTFNVSASDIVDGQTPVTCTPASGSTFPIGVTTVTCSTKDAHGNAATGSFHITVKDTTPPMLMLPGNSIAEALSPSGTPMTYNASANDSVDGPTPVTCTPPSGSLFPPGTTKVTCTSTDSHGNTATGSFTITIRDTTPPVVTVPGTTPVVEATGPSGAAVTFTASATDNLDGPTAVTCTPASGSTFPLGTNVVNCVSKDSSGNSGHASFNILVQDTTAPAFGTPTGTTAEATSAGGASVNFKIAATDLVDGARPVTCTQDPGSYFSIGTSQVTCTAADTRGNKATTTFSITVQDTTPPVIKVPADPKPEATGPNGALVTYTVSAADVVDGNTMVYCMPLSGSVFPVGQTVVSCNSTDRRGNEATATFTITVQDTKGPVITPQAMSTFEATSAAGAVVTYSVTAFDTVDGIVAATCTPPSGSTLPIGTDTITCQSTDAHNNTSTTSFTVKVQDTVAPVVTVPMPITAEATNYNGAPVTFMASAVDNIDGPVPVKCFPSSGDTFPFGTTNTVCVATDAHGNTGSANLAVTVQDTTPPVMMLPMDIVTDAMDATGAKVTFTAVGMDTADGAIPADCTPASGSLFPPGETTVWCTATDRHSNMASGSFHVTVQDMTPPVLTLPEDIKAEATSAQGAAVTFDATAQDGVDGNVPVTCTPASGSTFPVGMSTVTCSASDRSMNTATGSFHVTVTETSPTTPMLVGPADGAYLPEGTIQLEWTSSTSVRGTKVTYQVTVTPQNGQPVTQTADVNTVFFGGDSKLPDGSYSWSVTAADSRGISSASSPTWSFTVGKTPPMPDAGTMTTDAGPTMTSDAGPVETPDAGTTPSTGGNDTQAKKGGCSTGAGNASSLAFLIGLAFVIRRRPSALK